jgi:hypothetical protein
MRALFFTMVLGLVANVASAQPGGDFSGAHGPVASHSDFPSHVFRLAPRWHDRPEIAFHLGLFQPIFFGGFNVAADLRWGPMVLSYSHGQGLDYGQTPALGLSSDEREAGLSLESPWTTGGGVGVVLLDELYVMVDLKVHRYEASIGEAAVSYTTVSVGAEIGWRFFVWRGFFLQPVVRFWPNVHTSLDGDAAMLGTLRHEAKDLGFFANVLVGWAFDA